MQDWELKPMGYFYELNLLNSCKKEWEEYVLLEQLKTGIWGQQVSSLFDLYGWYVFSLKKHLDA